MINVNLVKNENFMLLFILSNLNCLDFFKFKLKIYYYSLNLDFFPPLYYCVVLAALTNSLKKISPQMLIHLLYRCLLLIY